jgi:phage terminase large subunit-like protein
MGQRALYRGGDNPDNLRGMAASAAWIDEITLCHDPQILPVVQGRLLDLKGRLRFTGTPKGKNWLWQDVMQTLTETEPGRVWQSERWEVFRFPTRENPGIEASELEKLAADYPAKLRQQELEGEFIDWGGVVFSSESITAALMRGPKHYAAPMSGHTVCIGVDPAGKGRDWWAVTISCLSCRLVSRGLWPCRLAVNGPAGPVAGSQPQWHHMCRGCAPSPETTTMRGRTRQQMSACPCFTSPLRRGGSAGEGRIF